jgi:hypothetical protein
MRRQSALAAPFFTERGEIVEGAVAGATFGAAATLSGGIVEGAEADEAARIKIAPAARKKGLADQLRWASELTSEQLQEYDLRRLFEAAADALYRPGNKRTKRENAMKILDKLADDGRNIDVKDDAKTTLIGEVMAKTGYSRQTVERAIEDWLTKP